LPIPSAIPRAPRPAACERDGCRAALVGHFGTYGSHIAPLLRSGLTALLDAEPSAAAICIGAGSDRFVADLAGARPDLRLRLTATGRASPHAAAAHILACDLMLQPYPDGVTTRRTSVMACLINGRAVVTTGGALTEPEWAGSGAVALVPSGDPRQLVEAARALLADGQARAALGARGEAVYRARFALEHTITALRGRPAGAAA
ncbi:MAG TPA: hypothetical protein VLD67_13840, partial [Vicinamibacterales bacterium]|nr:hypothetical protein [Vicinamibacterales bacterium]